MPTYRYSCEGCGPFERWRPIREPSETCPCPECGVEASKVFTPPRIGLAATPNRAPDAQAIVAKDAAWNVDMPAYRRLRNNGVQPKSIDGSAALEARAETKTEIEDGRLMPLPQAKFREEVKTVAAEMRQS